MGEAAHTMIDLASLLGSPAGVVGAMRLGMEVFEGRLGLAVGLVVLVVAAILLLHLL